MLKSADAEVEVDILLLHHGIGHVDQVVGAFHDGEGDRRQVQFSAFHFGNIQNIVDQCQKVVAGQIDLFQIITNGRAVLRVLPRNGGQANDGVHRRANVMRHGGQEIRLCMVGAVRGLGRGLQLTVEIHHNDEIEHQQQKQAGAHNAHQRPAHFCFVQFFHRYHRDNRPVVRRIDACVRDDTTFFGRIVDLNNAGRPHEAVFQLFQSSWLGTVIGLVELIKIRIFERKPFDDVITCRIDQRNLRVFIFLRRENPLFLKGGDRDDPQQNR